MPAQSEWAMHPRLAHAVEAPRDARACLQAAPRDFAGHRMTRWRYG